MMMGSSCWRAVADVADGAKAVWHQCDVTVGQSRYPVVHCGTSRVPSSCWQSSSGVDYSQSCKRRRAGWVVVVPRSLSAPAAFTRHSRNVLLNQVVIAAALAGRCDVL